MTDLSPALVWFRDDLRLADNPALWKAAESGRPLVCFYVHDERSPGLRPLGAAARWWLHGALAELDADLAKSGGRLLILEGDAGELIETLAVGLGAEAVHWNRRYGQAERDIDARVKAALHRRGIEAESFNGALLNEPWTVKNQAGGPFRIFRAYWSAPRQLGPVPHPLPAPKKLAFHDVPKALLKRAIGLDELHLEPTKPDWASGLRDAWHRGEAGGLARLRDFVEEGMRGYAHDRDRPDLPATSRLSPYLRFGNLSPRQVWHAAAHAVASGQSEAQDSDLEKFTAELGWREFSYHLLFHHPDLAKHNFQPKFDDMPWRTDEAALRAWQQGRTGYPLVDAGMRELWTTGAMHNRVRMVVASFLVKHLLIDWRQGEAWFWDTLVDADPANNPANWQWVAGTGIDAAPYFRVFNPTLQAQKFDPDGAYIRRWVSELAQVPTTLLHRPGAINAPGYPSPIVEHAGGRQRALAAWGDLDRA